jgi:predicted nucleic acid-binding protein
VGTVVLDTSALLALLDPGDALHDVAARAVRQHRTNGNRFAIPASVLAELLVGAARAGEDELELRRHLVTAAFGPPVPLDESIAVNAARIRAAHRSLRLPDALVLATVDAIGADVVLTADKQWKRIDQRVELLRPTTR